MNKPRRWLLIVLLAVFLPMDFLPLRSKPFFRYTGSDPERTVWHLGWPMPLAIYDPDAPGTDGSWFFAPHAAAVAAVQLLSLALLLRGTMAPNKPPEEEKEDP